MHTYDPDIPEEDEYEDPVIQWPDRGKPVTTL